MLRATFARRPPMGQHRIHRVTNATTFPFPSPVPIVSNTLRLSIRPMLNLFVPTASLLSFPSFLSLSPQALSLIGSCPVARDPKGEKPCCPKRWNPISLSAKRRGLIRGTRSVDSITNDREYDSSFLRNFFRESGNGGEREISGRNACPSRETSRFSGRERFGGGGGGSRRD